MVYLTLFFMGFLMDVRFMGGVKTTLPPLPQKLHHIIFQQIKPPNKRFNLNTEIMSNLWLKSKNWLYLSLMMTSLYGTGTKYEISFTLKCET